MIFLNIHKVHSQRGFSENLKLDIDYNNANLGQLFGSNRSLRSQLSFNSLSILCRKDGALNTSCLTSNQG